MNRKIKNILIVIGLAISSVSVAQEQIDLFILAGQSNAQGWKSSGANYPVDSNSLDSEIRLNSTFIGGDDGLANLSTDGWITMQAQSGRYADNGHFGPEVTLSRKLKLIGYNPAIFKYCKGGSYLATEWKQPGSGGYYDDMVTDLNTAITELENLGHTVNVRGFVWIQGEEDAKNETHTAAYEANLILLINDLRNNVIEDISLPIVLGVDDARDRNIPIAGFQKNIASGDDTIIFTSMIGLAKADATHLTSAGVIEQGEVMFNDYKAAFISDFNDLCSIEQTSSNKVASLIHGSWGQSFTPTCDGVLEEITFDSQTALSGGVTITIGTENNCSGASSTILGTKTLTNLIVGDNTVVFGDVALSSETTYYFKVTTNIDGEVFTVAYNKPSVYEGGYLFTHQPDSDKSACDYPFNTGSLDFDWKFTLAISDKALLFSNINSLPEHYIIHPNPVENNFVVFNNKGADLFIYNITGKLIFNVKVDSNEQSIDVNDLNSGVYYLAIKNNGIVFNKKILKK